jgi:hypothetical protein
MSNTELEKIWMTFAESINGSVNQTVSTRFKADNIFNIENEIASVDMIWADYPTPGKGHITNIKTNFNYKLPAYVSTSLRILPKDTLSEILLIFERNKQKTEIPEIDKKYILVSNSNDFIRKITPELTAFFKGTSFTSFVIDTSKDDDQNTLNIQVNALLVSLADLNFFYEFGLQLCSRLKNAL